MYPKGRVRRCLFGERSNRTMSFEPLVLANRFDRKRILGARLGLFGPEKSLASSDPLTVHLDV